jgi:hypothetical protein
MELASAVKNNITTFKAGSSAMKIHTLEAAEKIALKIKDYTALEKAIDDKLEEQALFAANYKVQFQHGGDKKSEEYQNDSTVVLKPSDYCQQFGFGLRMVQRWAEKLLDAESKEKERNQRKSKVQQLVSMEQAANYSSESIEWYTPEKYIEAVRKTMGGIDLDPASCEVANKVVKATQFYTEKENSIDKDWHSKVFLNPPYGRLNGDSLAGLFCDKAIAEYELGNTEQTIILINSVHSQNWQACLYEYPVCFVDHRIQFVSGDGEENKNPTFQNIFVYLGKNKQKFAEVFSEWGYVMEKII